MPALSFSFPARCLRRLFGVRNSTQEKRKPQARRGDATLGATVEPALGSGGEVRRLDRKEAMNQRKIPPRFEVKVTAGRAGLTLARRARLQPTLPKRRRRAIGKAAHPGDS